MSKISRAKDITIEDYLKYPKFYIPLFQREYVWGKEEIEEFWNDLIEENVQFLGSFILKDENYNHDNKTGFLEIVDGQQRTVSILLLLKNISRNLNILAGSRIEQFEKNAERQAEDIDGIISKRDRRDMTKVLNYKLELYSEEANQAFAKILNGDSVEGKEFKGLIEAQNKLNNLFADYLNKHETEEQKIDFLIDLKIRILDIKVIEVLVPTDEDAYLIFEAVNDRGADLGAADLLKNYLFSKTTNKSLQSEIHQEWQRIKKTLLEVNKGSLDMTSFFRYYWIGTYEHVTKKALYSGFKKRINNKDSSLAITPYKILQEIQEFRNCIEEIFLYRFDDWHQIFINLNSDDGDEKRIIRRATEWFSYKRNLLYFPKSIQFLPVYAAVIRNLDKINLKDRSFINLFLEIEKINFVYSYLLQKPTNRIDTIFSGIGREIFNVIMFDNSEANIQSVMQKSIRTLNNFLRDNVTKEEVYEAIANLNYKQISDKQIINFILVNLEYFQGGYVRLLEDNLTKDHIYPQSVEKKGVISDWPKLDFDYKKFGHSLGNLTLLASDGPQANGSAEDKAFLIKRDDFYLKSPFAINQYFRDIEQWGGKEIMDRLKHIQDLVWERWGYSD